MADSTVTKIVSEADAASLLVTLEGLTPPPQGPGFPVVLRSKVTIIKDDLPNIPDGEV